MKQTYFFANEFSHYEEILTSNSKNITKYCTGNIIELNTSQFLYIKQGMLKLSAIYKDGREKTLAYIGEKSICPNISINGNYNDIGYIITAVSNTVIFPVNQNLLDEISISDITFINQLCKHYHKIMQFAFQEIVNISFEKADIRVAKIIDCLKESNNKSSKSELLLSQEDMASLAGISKIQVVRSYKDLKSKNIIQVKKNKLFILDTNLLHSYISNV